MSTICNWASSTSSTSTCKETKGRPFLRIKVMFLRFLQWAALALMCFLLWTRKMTLSRVERIVAIAIRTARATTRSSLMERITKQRRDLWGIMKARRCLLIKLDRMRKCTFKTIHLQASLSQKSQNSPLIGSVWTAFRRFILMVSKKGLPWQR